MNKTPTFCYYHQLDHDIGTRQSPLDKNEGDCFCNVSLQSGDGTHLHLKELIMALD